MLTDPTTGLIVGGRDYSCVFYKGEKIIIDHDAHTCQAGKSKPSQKTAPFGAEILNVRTGYV